MSIEEKKRKHPAPEYGEPWNPVPGALRVALIYPNTYWVGMSNLGFQTTYHLLNLRKDLSCERFFYPDREEREKVKKGGQVFRSLETGSLLNAFDLLAFSVSFELDYLHVVEILRAGKIPPLRESRIIGRDPMVWIGGIGVSINPEPLAEFSDLIFIGEGEEMLQEALDALIQSPVKDRQGFDRFCGSVRDCEGVYLPHAYTFHYNSRGAVTTMEHQPGFPSKIKRRWVRDLDLYPTVSRILTPDTELNDMFLIELDRGCGRHCRFCAAGYLYRPPRFRSVESVLQSVREGLIYTDRIGLVGTAVSDYPWMPELLAEIHSLGARLSISSLRADSVTPLLMGALARSGHKTVALAPEGGSQRLREIINKGITEKVILDACRMTFSSEILNLKLYFMVGLPFEEDEDLDALVALVLKIKEIQLQEGKKLGRIGRITVSLNCFVPKPHTPFQWCPMNKKGALSTKISYIKAHLRKEGNVTVIHDLPKWAIIQGLLSRGDRRISALLCSVAEKNGNWAQALKAFGKGLEDSTFRGREENERFPWDLVESGCRREFLYQEYERSASRRLTPSCPEDLDCRRCGVCGEPGEQDD